MYFSERLIRFSYLDGQLNEALFDCSTEDEIVVCIVCMNQDELLSCIQYFSSIDTEDEGEIPRFEFPDTSIDDLLRVFKTNVEYGHLSLLSVTPTSQSYGQDVDFQDDVTTQFETPKAQSLKKRYLKVARRILKKLKYADLRQSWLHLPTK